MFNYTNQSNEVKVGKVIAHILVILFVVIPVVFFSWNIIDAGERGVVLKLGKVNRVMEPGFNFKIPYIENVIKFEIVTQKIEVEAKAASKDLQDVTTNIALQFHLDPLAVGIIYEELRTVYRQKIIDPAIQDTVKAITAQFNASELITKRAEVKESIIISLTKRLSVENIIVENLDIVDFKFSNSFNQAIEAKVTAEQKALEAENKLKQVEFEAQQRIEQARGEAEAIRIQAQAITQQGGKDYVNLKAVEKWDGKLPQQFVPGSAVPFLNLIK